jgi:hypothetical protein
MLLSNKKDNTRSKKYADAKNYRDKHNTASQGGRRLKM